jgi:hypothetical protein
MAHKRKAAGAIALCLVLWTTGASLSLAQIKSGSIVGSVTDKTGALVPDANVSITNEETKVITPVKTDSAGQYAVPYLEAGRYTVRIEKTGFVAFEETGVSVTVGQQARVDAQLQIGSAATRVEVVANLAKLQTESTSFTSSVNARAIEAIPNINSNPFYYATLLPGVVGSNETADTSSPYSFGLGMQGRTQFVSFSVNGGQDLTNRLSVDGVNTMATGNNEAAVLPNPDGIQEVRTIVNDYTAEYGRASGVVDIITKGGTNRYHGSVFGRVRNEALNANSFANNQLGITKAPFKVGVFGGTMGGPIKKDKLFFFASYQGLVHHTGADWLETVPTPLEKQGNFGQTLVNYNGTPEPAQIYNPFNVTQIGPNLYQRALIPNAIITNPDSYGEYIINQYPDPNRAPIDLYNDDNYFYRGLQTFRGDNVNARVDYYRGKHSFYGSGGIEDSSISTPNTWGPKNPFYNRGPNGLWLPALQTDKNPYGSIGDTISLSPTLIADIRFGVQRVNTIFGSRSYPNFDYNTMGVPASVQAIMPSHEFAPDVLPSRYSDLGETLSEHKHERQTNSDLEASLTKVLGKWTLKNGVEFLDDYTSYQDFEEGSARLDLGPAWCTNCGSGFTSQYITSRGVNTAQDNTAMNSGFDAADFALGAGSYYIVPGRSILPDFNERYLGLYTQNDWRPTSRLTVNLGLRWDLQPGPSERWNRFSAFDATKMNPFGSQGVTAFPGTDGYSRNLWNTHWRDFGPRFGVAYRLRDTLVVRGGYGITYMPMNTGYFDGTYNYGSISFGNFTGELPYGPTPAGVVTCTFHDASCSPILQGVGSNTSAPQLYGTGPNVFPRNFLNARVQQWNVFVEKSLHSDWLFSIGYAATHGDHLMVARWPYGGIGLLPQSIDNCYRNGTGCPANDAAVTGHGYVQTAIDPAYDPVTNPWNPTGTLPFDGYLATSTINRYVLDSTYPMFQGQSGGQSFGYSNYNSLSVQVKHAFAHGLQLDTFFTWSKSMGLTSTETEYNVDDNGSNADWFDLRNPKQNYQLTGQDFPARFVAIVVYELPFGSGKKFDFQNRAARYVISGWKVGGVQQTQSGYPEIISGASNGALNSRPFRVAGEPLEVPKALQHWYNGTTTVTLPDGRSITPCADCFLKYNPDAYAGSVIPDPTQPGQYIADDYWMGTAGGASSYMRSWGRNNLDISIMRDFRLTEKVTLELRANMTNFLNHPQFKDYSGGLGGQAVVADPTTHTQVGQPTGSSSFGTMGNSTYDPRQTEFQLTFRF